LFKLDIFWGDEFELVVALPEILVLFFNVLPSVLGESLLTH